MPPGDKKKDKPDFKVETVEEPVDKPASDPVENVDKPAPQPMEEKPQEKPPEKPEVKSSPVIEEKPEAKKPSSNKSVVFSFLGGLILGGLLTGGVLYFRDNVEKKQTQAVFTATPEPSPTQNPSLEEELGLKEVDFSKLSVQILNGSGIAGEAGRVKALVEVKGFESFETGNAGAFDFEETEISVKEELSSEVYDTIAAALESYEIVEGDALDEDSEFDVIIIVGSSKANEK